MKKQSSLRLWLACCAVILFGAFLRLCAYGIRENSVDGFYHMRMARQGWGVYAGKVFPATTLSSWKECFADKELLYHILLSGVDKVRDILNLPAFPFHFGALFFFALLCVTFAVCAKVVTLQHPEYPMLLFAVLTPLFCNRMLMLRPHTFAVTLMLFSCIVYAKCPRKYLLAGSFLCGVLFAWGYSNPHFVFLAAGGFAFGFFWSERQRSWRLLGGTALGLAAGFILHPQFPNNCINWYIQCVVVPTAMFGELRVVELGREMQSSGIAMSHLLKPLFFLQVAVCGLAVFLFRRDRKKLFEPEMLAIGAIFAVTAVGNLFALRVVEYAQPFTGLCLAMLAERAWPETRFSHFLRGAGYALLSFFCAWICWVELVPTELDLRPPERLAAFVRSRKIPANTVIANHEWGAFPLLYYSLPEYRYLCGLDPCFALAVEPLRIAQIEAQRRNVNHTLFAPADFADVVRARLLYVEDGALAKRLCENGYAKHLIYQGEDGYLFHLPQH